MLSSSSNVGATVGSLMNTVRKISSSTPKLSLGLILIIITISSNLLTNSEAKHHKKYDMSSSDTCKEKYNEIDSAEISYTPNNKRRACRVKFKTDNFDQLFLVKMLNYDIQDCGTRLRIFSEDDPAKAIDMSCNPTALQPTLFKTNKLVAELTGMGAGSGKGFNALITTMAKRAICGGFRCKSDKYCIDDDLRCDGVEQCVDGSDERDCSMHGTKKALKIGAGIIAAIVIGILLCCALTIGACIWFMRRRRENV